MKQYLVIGRDGKDEKALERRMAARPEHMDKIKSLNQSGNFIAGGAILDDKSEKMVGSAVFVQFESSEDLNNWLSTEPYINGKVWEDYEVSNVRLVQL